MAIAERAERAVYLLQQSVLELTVRSYFEASLTAKSLLLGTCDAPPRLPIKL